MTRGGGGAPIGGQQGPVERGRGGAPIGGQQSPVERAHQSVDSREEEEKQAIQGQGADSLVRGRVGLEGLQTNK